MLGGVPDGASVDSSAAAADAPLASRSAALRSACLAFFFSFFFLLLLMLLLDEDQAEEPSEPDLVHPPLQLPFSGGPCTTDGPGPESGRGEPSSSAPGGTAVDAAVVALGNLCPADPPSCGRSDATASAAGWLE